MDKVKLIVKSVSDKVQAGAYALLLAEENGSRELPVIVGVSEAQSILIAFENIQTPRPLTHDLFKEIFKELEAKVKEVYIHKYEDGVFYSEIRIEVVKSRKKRIIVIDARTSDAIAIALRVGCDIFISSAIINSQITTQDQIMADSSALLKQQDSETDDDSEESDDSLLDLRDYIDANNDDSESDHLIAFVENLLNKDENSPSLLGSKSISELNWLMSRAINNEDYEQAQLYRDEIIRRGGEPKIDDGKLPFIDDSDIPF
jgi:bifunctional DNase/RNase